MTSPAPHHSTLLESLAALTAAHPHARKRLVGLDVNYGRELLQSLARVTGGWVGWEAVNLRGIADELAFVPLSESGARSASDVEVAALVNEALDAAIADGRVRGQFAELSRSLGFRRALRDALLEARLGGVTPAQLLAAANGNPSAIALASVLAAYEGLLAERALGDAAMVLHMALDAFDDQASFVLDGMMALSPSISTRGLAGALVARIREHGAQLLEADAPADLTPPSTVLASAQANDRAPDEQARTRSLLALISGSAAPDVHAPHLDRTLAHVDMFVAATPAEEIREVCRRVVAEGLRWDDVEIVATDPDSYGIALDALCGQLDIGVTMLKGLPIARTRLGRALERWFTWVGDGLPADVLRQALEAGELSLADSDAKPSRLASELRQLAIGWGRARYDAAIVHLTDGTSVASLSPRDNETPEEFRVRRGERQQLHADLARLLQRVLATVPPVQERGTDAAVYTNVHVLARAALAYFELVVGHGQAEQRTRERLIARLSELERIPQPEVTFANALAALREALADLRAWPLITSERKPWSSAGGMVHLTDLPHAGTTNRPRTFVVGLDADRTRGGTLQDPVLSDRVRSAVGASLLATTSERHASSAWRIGSALASLRGRVTLSYAMNAALDGREAGPSPLLLQAWRLVEENPTLTFDDMRSALVPPACAVPTIGAMSQALDARDVWLSALADGPLVLDGNAQTREAFPSLAAGLDAVDAAGSAVPSAFHGIVPIAGPALDPLARDDREISPSSLEKLAACPLAWFYHYGLRVSAPSDPEYDAERWLDAMQRGVLLHSVYERFVAAYLDRQDELALDSATADLRAEAERAIAEWRAEVPPPSEMVFSSEAEQLRRDAMRFLQLEREQRSADPGARWTRVELPFGWQHDGEPRPPGHYRLADGRVLRVKGRADRLDTLADGRLRVVDYKTGSPTRFAKDNSHGAFKGGRQLQPALYAAAVETVTGHPVGSFEYRFPTERGESEVVAYSAHELESARTLVSDLLGQVERGEFVPTNDPDDCTYCDFATICRASTGRFSKTWSPRANWAVEQGGRLELYTPMRTRRGEDVNADTAAQAAADSEDA
jgi:CRISPR/Cas system-associated exonuclease Cas4 (RecB family)